MADIKDNAYTILRNDFLNIKPENGFENTVKAVYEGERLPSQMPDKPAVCIVFDVDSQKEELVAEQEEIRILPILIYIFYQATLDTCAELKKSLIRDFDKMFYRSNSILSDYHSHLKQAGIRTEYHIRAYDPEFTPLTQNQGCIAIRIDLDYYKNADIVDSYSFSLTSIPTADSRFTLTSVTEALRNRVNELAISGANVWGTISGSLSAQSDLQTELNSRSLTGHSHSEYLLNSNTGSLTSAPVNLNPYTLTSDFVSSTASLYGSITGIDLANYATTGSLSGYLQTSVSGDFSLTSHNHALSGLSEKSYNSLDDKPNLNIYATTSELSGYSITSHNHSLSGLTEKNYNSLDGLPNLNAYSLTGHTHPDLATTSSLSGYVANSTTGNYILTSTFISATGSLTGATLLTRYSPSGWTYFVNTTDKVGIGYSPNAALGYTLDVSGKIRCTDNLYTNAALYSDTAIWSPVFKPRYNTPFEFRNYTNQTLGIALSSGQWGIGTLTPNEKFSISGNLSVTGNIIVNGLSGYNGTVTAGQTMSFSNGILTSIT